MSHIIGRPDADLLDVMLGHGAHPEQAIGGSEQGLEEGDGFGDRLLGDESTVPELNRAGRSAWVWEADEPLAGNRSCPKAAAIS